MKNGRGFCTVIHSSLIVRLRKYGLERQTIQLNCWAQRMVTNDMTPSWWLAVPGSLLRGCYVGPYGSKTLPVTSTVI